MGRKKKTIRAGVDLNLFYERLCSVSGFSSQKEIANDCGINETSFSRMLNGKQPLQLDDLLNISSRYHCSIDYLLGLGESVAISDHDLTSFTEIINIFSALFDKGVFKLSDDSKIEFCNDVFPFLWNEVKRKKLDVVNGNDSEEDFETWLIGFCSSFDFLFPNRKTLEELKAEHEEMKALFDFDDSMQVIRPYEDWKKECEKYNIKFNTQRDSYSAYCEDVFCFIDTNGCRMDAKSAQENKAYSYLIGNANETLTYKRAGRDS